MKTQLNRRQFLTLSAGGIAGAALSQLAAHAAEPAQRLNILLITADDMDVATPGCSGGKVPGVTPNIDALAKEGLRFEHAHVTCAVCMPSRETLMTGRYPHRHGGMGFYQIRNDVPTLQEQLKAAGYLLGILGKTEHLAPEAKFAWDVAARAPDLAMGRDPQSYYKRTREFIEQALREKKPFFLMANSHDPHRPFSGSPQETERNGTDPKYPPPSRIYRPEEVDVPGFLPDIPDVRREIAYYYSSSRRCDDTVGAVLKALKESGQEESTLVMFLSDNGMSFPFAKTNCYLRSTHTPWIVRWPGKVKPGTVDSTHFISGIDYMPTILEAAGLPPVRGMDGRSFLPLLSGGAQGGRDRVFTVFHETSGRKEFPMRCVQDQQFGYIHNAWADGKTVFRCEPQSGLTWKAMEEAAKTDPKVAQRTRMFSYRVPEELYDYSKDPCGLKNLADKPEYAQQLAKMRRWMLDWMTQTRDPLLPSYRARYGGSES